MAATEEYRSIVDSFNNKLAAVSGSITGIKPAEDKWSLKEIIGHLIDSASNNHQRFVRLQFGDLTSFPAYDAETWISAQKYNSMDWKEITALWYSYNCILLSVIGNMDEKAADNVWKTGEKELSLGFLVKDYYRHLKWHMDQFENRLNEVVEFTRKYAGDANVSLMAVNGNKNMKFSGICLITRNVPRLSGFYMKILDTKGEGDDTHMELSAHGTSIAIFSESGMEEMAPGSMEKYGHGCLTINFEVEDADAEYEKIKAMGSSIVKPPQTHPWGSRSFWFRDPDGNIVNFFCRI